MYNAPVFEAWKWKKRVAEVEEELDTLKRRLHTMEVEWLDTLDRMKRMLGRVVKERARAEAAQQEEVQEETAPTPSPGLDPISARILSRRSRLANGGREQ